MKAKYDYVFNLLLWSIIYKYSQLYKFMWEWTQKCFAGHCSAWYLKADAYANCKEKFACTHIMLMFALRARRSPDASWKLMHQLHKFRAH